MQIVSQTTTKNGDTMTYFLGGLEMMCSRKDGNCSRCTPNRINEGKKPFKAKWIIGGNTVGMGRVALDGSPATPMTYGQYSLLMTACEQDISKVWELLNCKGGEGHEVCGYCKNGLRQGDWSQGYLREPLAAWDKELKR